MAISADLGEGMGARKAPVHRDGLPVHVGGLLAGEEERGRRDLRGQAVPVERVELTDLSLGAACAGELEDGPRHPGLGEAGADGVHADAGAGERIGRGLDQADHPRLARRVRGAAGVGAKSRHRRRADDGAAALPDHHGRRVLDEEPGADQVDAQDLLPLLDGLLEEGDPPPAHPRVGEDHVHATPFGHAAAHHPRHRGLVARVGGDGEGGPAHGGRLRGGGVQLRDRAVHREHPRALAGEEEEGGTADAAGRAGDDRALAAESAHEGRS
jgi:hypothetical protein